MQLRQPSPDALVSFSDFLLERFGLVATMQAALLGSLAFHVLLIVGLGFKVPGMPKWDAPHNVMDVVLVNSRSATKPTKADALAQANLDGGGNTDEKLRAASPFPTVDDRDPSREMKAAAARVKQLEVEARELMTRIKSKATVTPMEVAPPAPDKPDAEARDLIEKSAQIANLEAQIRRQMQAYQERPKKKYVGARAEESRFAVYVDKWRQKVERVGNLNYPEEARTRRLHGSLQLTVGIKADGEIESVEINRPSGYKVLDQSAIRIVRLAAPFERLPDNIRVDTDILYITRTWSFTRSEQVVAE
jgi:protein TonB